MSSTMNKRWWALGALTSGVLAASLGGTILVVALPTLARELDATQSELVWFMASYLLVLAVAVLPVGLIGDWVGRKKVTMISLVAFAGGSVLCALATSAGAFIAGRVLQGLAGAGITVMAMSALIVMFNEDERPKAVGIYQAINFVALPLGPVLGGWMLSNFWWGWVFLINVPVVVIAVTVCAFVVPESRAIERPGLDPVGVTGSTAGLVLFVYGLIQAGEQGWTLGVALALGGGIGIIVAFVLWEHHLGRRPDGKPLISPALFSSASFMGGAVLAGVAGMAMIGVLITMPQYFQGVQETGVLASGLRLLPLIAGMVVGAASANWVARSIGARLTVTLGFLVLATGLVLGVETGVASSLSFIAAWTAVVGLGTGVTLASATAVALSGLSTERSGTESAVVQALNKTSGPLGTAIMGSVLVAVFQARLTVDELPASLAVTAKRGLYDALAVAQDIGSPALVAQAQAAFVDGLRVALMVSAGIAVLGALTAAALLPGKGSHEHRAVGARDEFADT